MPNILFICSKANWRSPTAEEVFSELPGYTTMCAGLDKEASAPLSSDMLTWADHILVMETKHKIKLTRDYSNFLKGKSVGVLGIPDNYKFMDPKLVALLKRNVPRFLKG